MLTRELLARLPKAELHTHLDGSLRPETMIELARERGFRLPTSDPGRAAPIHGGGGRRDLEDYLQRFDYHDSAAADPRGDRAGRRTRWWRTPRATTCATSRCATAPASAPGEGSRSRRRSRRSWRGLRAGRAGFRRHRPGDQLLAPALRPGGLGRDRASCRWPTATGAWWRSTWPAARRDGRPGCTSGHSTWPRRAGSASPCTPARRRAPSRSPRRCDLCHADRIGHGTRLYEDPRLQNYVRDRRVLIEINITSNVQTRAVAAAAEHPVRGYYDAGVAVTLCTDSWLMCGVTLTDEYWLAHTAARVHPRGDRRDDPQWIRRRRSCRGPERRALVEQVRAELADAPVTAGAADAASSASRCSSASASCFSHNRRRIRWQVVGWGLGLQVLFAIFVLRVPGRPGALPLAR